MIDCLSKPRVSSSGRRPEALFGIDRMRAVAAGFLLCISLLLGSAPAQESAAPASAAASAPVKAKTPHGFFATIAHAPAKLMEGGWTVAIQLLLSVLAGAYAIERFTRLRRKSIVPDGLAEKADALWREGKYAEILSLCERNPSTLGRIIKFIVTHKGNPITDVSRAIGDIGGREMRQHIQRAYPLAVVGMLEPLLGLLGTVLGMMETFAAVADAGALGDASVLAHGISKFLVCTGAGLFIAVPCLSLYHYFKLRSTSMMHELEEQVDGLLHGWFLKRESFVA
ncbi:MAG: MotA/TolQ/ExbB proton channel family protein [Planctomycetes bacterium]|nr:MotA/TolQ/ExbB proton channel family protein [Planctomycetota bacterium]